MGILAVGTNSDRGETPAAPNGDCLARSDPILCDGGRRYF